MHGPCRAGQDGVWGQLDLCCCLFSGATKISPILKLPHPSSLIQGPRGWVCLEGQLVPAWFLVSPGLACLCVMGAPWGEASSPVTALVDCSGPECLLVTSDLGDRGLPGVLPSEEVWVSPAGGIQDSVPVAGERG